jgi:hypothetical protein
MIRNRAYLAFLISSIVVILHAAAVRAADVTSTYSGADANWSTAAWLNVPPLGGFPNNGNAGVATYDAIFNGGSTLTLDRDITIQKFTMGTGSVAVQNFSLTTNGLLHVTDGRILGSGIINANGGLQIDGYQNFLDVGYLFNAGSATFTGSVGNQMGILSVNGTIDNSGTFDSGWAGNFSNFIESDGFAPHFVNEGTFTRSVGTGTTQVDIPFDNYNTVTVQAGRLVLSGGGYQAGSLQAASGATLVIGVIGGFGTTFDDGSSLSGPGTIIIAGTVSVTGPAVTYSGGGTLLLTGTLNGPGTLTATSPIHVTGGVMSGNGVTNANGGLQIDGIQNFVDTRTVNVGGSSAFTGSAPSQAGYFYLSNGATLTNTGSFDSGWAANFDNTILPNGVTGTFTNSGTFTRSVGSGTTTVSVPFNNSGIVNIQSGTLTLDGGGASTGQFQLVAGAPVNFTTTAYNFNAGTSFTGNGAANIKNGTVTLTGTTTATAATTLVIGGSGIVNGGGTLTDSGLLKMSGGTMSGNGVTNANGGLQIDGIQNFVDTRTVNVAGSSAFSGSAPSQAGYLYLSNGATLTNTGTFDSGWAANFDNTILPNGVTGTFTNSGTFTRSVGSGTTTVSVPFNNSGTVNIQSGTLTLDGGGASTGQFQLVAGAPVNFTTTVYNFNAGTSFTGNGAANIKNGTVTLTGTTTATAATTLVIGGSGIVNGGGTLTDSGLLKMSGGTMSGNGVTNANGGLQIDGVQNFVDTRTVNVGGSSAFTGSAPSQAGYLYLSNGATLTNTGSFDSGWATNFDNTILPNGVTGTFTNSGTFTRSVGSATTSVLVPFTNTGTVDVEAGKLEFDAAVSLGNNSSLKVSGGTLRFNVDSGLASVGSGITATVSGSGTLELAGSASALGVGTPVANRAAITNTSSAAAGLLVSAGNQQVGAVSGSGNVQVNAGTSLTADSIIAGALLIGGASGNPAKVTIAASDENGEPLGEGLATGTGDLATTGSAGLAASPENLADSSSLSALDAPVDNPSSGAASPISRALHGDVVPEPSSIILTMVGAIGLSSLVFRRRKQKSPWTAVPGLESFDGNL